ncbi:hypothetical protein [Cupriavidus pampae]|uniref:Uncharacterized protein n=1 Tax=Cupriavidus pampae TaxID=659251 RepID=A0ABN7ZDQ1_9BURK|nr:hypothetical protein [Cupriavidus pampae]CAG9183784.1 hypothetical protein LMG32289_05419 [Cupriavidus pampae]
MTAPTREQGMTRLRRAKQCSSKQRFADELSAKAWGATRQQATGTPLWVYRCNQCRGYHLTRSDNGPGASVMADLVDPHMPSAAENGCPDYLK